ncbi:MAG: T9SS type A sorting domain-containing protein [Flavobacterium sp. JAD_PAG50586_2]|nr:MAG: T9SS type A sorting domain-containing protein [Flavobacterium sp. JAD_PAG50586_2]
MRTSLHNLMFFGNKETKNSPQTVYPKEQIIEQPNVYSLKIVAILFILFNLFAINNASAQKTWDGGASNDNWSDAQNWNGNVAPVSTDNVVIPNGFTAILDTSVTVASLTVGGGSSGTFTIGNGNANRTLTVTGNVTVNAGATLTSAGNGGNDLIIGGNLTNAGTFTDNSADVDVAFNGSNQTISGAGNYLFNTITFSGGGTKTLSSNITVSNNWTNNGGTFAGTGTVTLDGSSSIGGSATSAFPNLTITGTVSQGINTSVTGNYLQTGGSYTVTPGSTAYTLSVTGNFTQSGGVFYVTGGSATAGATVTVSGNTSIFSIFMEPNESNTASTVLFQANGNVTFTGSSTTDSLDWMDGGSPGSVYNITFGIKGNFNWSNTSGRPYTNGSGRAKGFVFNGTGTLAAPQTLTYSGSSSSSSWGLIFEVSANTCVKLLSSLALGAQNNPASTFTIDGILDAQNAVISGSIASGVKLNSGATLVTSNTGGVTSTITATSPTYNSAANYIFNGAANQTANFGNANINNLTISNTSGSVTLNAAITASGNVLINSGGGSLTAGNFSHNIGGNWTRNGSFVQGTSTINLNGSSSQTIGGSSTTFNNLTLANSTKVFGVSTIVNGNLTIASSAVANLGSITTHTAGTLTLGTFGTVAAKFGSISTSGTAPVYKNDTYFTPTTIGYVTVGSSSCIAPTITFSSIPNICEGATSLSLPYTATTGSPNLYSISGTGITAVTNGTLNPPSSSITVNLSTPAVAGTVSSTAFTVSNSTTGCVSNNINGSVTVIPAANAGNDGALTICAGSTVTLAQLNAAITGEQPGGTWTPALGGAGTYTYTVSATSPCTAPDSSQVIVSAQAQPNAGADGILTICAGSTVTLAQLNAAITGEDESGSWTPTLAGAGTYTYTVNATSPCVAPDVSQVVVTEQAGPNAGNDGVYTICSGTNITLSQLQAAITGEDAGGTWTPVLGGAGTYTYTVAATSPCTAPDTSIVVVTAVSCQAAELSNCGNTPVLTSINARIFVSNTVTQATKYRYRVAVSTTPSSYFYAETNYPSFRLTDVVGLTPAYGTTYNVEIQNEFLLGGNTVASAYGTLCTVTTQAATDIAIPVNQCGQTLAAVNSKIYVNGVTGATMYTYRIAKQSAPTTYSYIETPYSNFRLTNPPTSGNVAIQHDEQYIVAVSATTTNGVSDFNSPCVVGTPQGPVTTIQGSQCGDDDNPYLIRTSSTKVYAANLVSGATYTFKLEQYSGNVLVDTNEATSPINYFDTNMFTGENALLPDTNYHVFVRINYYGEGEYDHDCVVRTPAALKNEEMTNEFKAVAYPNPFANNFMIDVKSASKSEVNLKVYDMIGRMIDQKEVRMSDLETTEIGNNYPSGVYNIIVSQESNTQTVRVVKR